MAVGRCNYWINRYFLHIGVEFNTDFRHDEGRSA
jgi:hypothetical protein